MPYRFRAPDDNDWPQILKIANTMKPWAEQENTALMEKHKQFSAGNGNGSQYVVELHPGAEVCGFGAVEEDPEPTIFRVYLVGEPSLLSKDLATVLYNRLEQDLINNNAKKVWAREYARNQGLIDFFDQRGFEETRRWREKEGEPKVVILEKKLV